VRIIRMGKANKTHNYIKWGMLHCSAMTCKNPRQTMLMEKK